MSAEQKYRREKNQAQLGLSQCQWCTKNNRQKISHHSNMAFFAPNPPFCTTKKYSSALFFLLFFSSDWFLNCYLRRGGAAFV